MTRSDAVMLGSECKTVSRKTQEQGYSRGKNEDCFSFSQPTMSEALRGNLRTCFVSNL